MGKICRSTKRVSGIVALIDKTTYCDPHSREKKHCIVMVNEPEGIHDQWRIPRVRIPFEILDLGPQAIGEDIRRKLSHHIGFTVDELTFEEELADADRTFLLFTSITEFCVATDSIYHAVEAKCIEEIYFMHIHGKVSRFHYETAKAVLAETR